MGSNDVTLAYDYTYSITLCDERQDLGDQRQDLGDHTKAKGKTFVTKWKTLVTEGPKKFPKKSAKKILKQNFCQKYF